MSQGSLCGELVLRSPRLSMPHPDSSVTGHAETQALRRTGAAGRAAVQAVLAVLRSAAVAPGGCLGSVRTVPAQLWQGLTHRPEGDSVPGPCTLLPVRWSSCPVLWVHELRLLAPACGRRATSRAGAGPRCMCWASSASAAHVLTRMPGASRLIRAPTRECVGIPLRQPAPLSAPPRPPLCLLPRGLPVNHPALPLGPAWEPGCLEDPSRDRLLFSSREGGRWGALVAGQRVVPAGRSDVLAERVSAYQVREPASGRLGVLSQFPSQPRPLPFPREAVARGAGGAWGAMWLGGTWTVGLCSESTSTVPWCRLVAPSVARVCWPT